MVLGAYPGCPGGPGAPSREPRVVEVVLPGVDVVGGPLVVVVVAGAAVASGAGGDGVVVVVAGGLPTVDVVTLTVLDVGRAARGAEVVVVGPVVVVAGGAVVGVGDGVVGSCVVVGLSTTAVTTSVGGSLRATSTRVRARKIAASPYRPALHR